MGIWSNRECEESMDEIDRFYVNDIPEKYPEDISPDDGLETQGKDNPVQSGNLGSYGYSLRPRY